MSGILFNARDHQPQQGGGVAHPVGTFDAQITNTSAQKTKDGSGTMFVVELTTPGGKIDKRYNVQNQSQQAVEIANKELSALCHSVGIFSISAPTDAQGNLDMPNVGKEMRGSRLKIEVGFQIDKETKQPTAYTEVKKVLDVQGNEPGRAAAVPQPQQQPVVNQQAPPAQNGAWAGQPQNNAPANGAGGWQPGPTQQPGPAAQPGGWTQQPTQGNQAPPWGNR